MQPLNWKPTHKHGTLPTLLAVVVLWISLGGGCNQPRGIAPIGVTLSATAVSTQEPVQTGSSTPQKVETISQFEPTPASIPSLTLPVATLTPSVTPSQAISPILSPTVTQKPASPTTISQSASPTVIAHLPKAMVRIQEPGNFSRVISPVNVVAAAIAGVNGTVQVELIGEDGRLLVREVRRFAVESGQWVGVNLSLDFEIPGVAEAARLQIHTDDGFGRTTSLGSVNLVLLSVGENELFPAGDTLEPFVVKNPRPNQAAEKGTLIVNGYIRPISSKPILFELVTNTGKLIGSRQIQMEESSSGKHEWFQTDIPYQLEAAIWGKLIIHQTGERIPGDAALASVPLLIKP